MSTSSSTRSYDAGPASATAMRDVGDDHPEPVVGEQLRAVGDGAVAHPLDQAGLDLDHDDLLDPAVAEHPVAG